MKFEIRSTSGSLGKIKEALKDRVIQHANGDCFVRIASLEDLLDTIKDIGTEVIIQPKAMYHKKGDTYGARDEYTYPKDEPTYNTIEVYDDYRE